MSAAWRPLAGVTRANLGRELLAGIALLAISVPLNIGYAQVAGLPPTAGLYALVVPSLLFALLACSRQLVIAPDAAGAALVGSALVGVVPAASEAYLVMAGAQAVICGLVLLVAARLRLSFLADFLSQPILVGFVGGLALDILVGQGAKMMGLALPAGARFPDKITELVRSLDQVELGAVLLSAGAVAVLVLGRRWARPVPWGLVVLTLATAASAIWSLDERGIVVLGTVPAGLAAPSLPQLDFHEWLTLIPSGLALAAVAIAQGLLLARSYAERHGHRQDAARDLTAMGVANIAAGCWSSFALGGSPSRTAAVAEAGARTQLPLVVVGLGALVLLLVGTPLLAPMPLPVIGAIVVVAVVRLIDLRVLARLWAVSRSEFIVAAVCAVGVLTAGPIRGLLIAFVVAVVNLVRRAARPSLEVLSPPAGPEQSLLEADTERTQTVPGVVIFRLAAPLFFANSAAVAARLLAAPERASDPLHTVVLDCEGVSDIDATAAERLGRAFHALQERGVAVALTRVRPALADRFTLLGLTEGTLSFPTNRAALAALAPAGSPPEEPPSDTPHP